ncbi:TMEM181 [Cordylochernes scorpioides]|uniref:TMEM181 n=1 Tax=Cordylochernes scorpioides TaxID=51811 RepID=A0ABY6JVZ6_9ARAC|nr:TMEM181 [Cordylochernes scorpioides]
MKHEKKLQHWSKNASQISYPVRSTVFCPPRRSVPMRLYTLHKRDFAILFAAFFACLTLCGFIGLAGPPITRAESVRASDLPSPLNRSHMATGPFVLLTPVLSPYSQQLWVLARVLISDGDQSFHKNFTVGVAIYAKTEEGRRVAVLDPAHNRTRDLRCLDKVCDGFTVLHLGFLDFPQYSLVVTFHGLEPIDAKYRIVEVVFYFKSYNPSFTHLEMWFRFIFVLLAFLMTCWLAHTLWPFYVCDWSIEQRWMFILLPLLLLYDGEGDMSSSPCVTSCCVDPVFPLGLLANSSLPGLLDAVFQASFLCTLLLFWLCIYHGIRQTRRGCATFYLPKLAVTGVLWTSAVTLASWQRVNQLRDPTYDYHLDTSSFTALKIVFFLAGGVYLLYLGLLAVRAFSELRSMPYFDVRLKFLTALTLVTLAVSVAVTALRFGLSAALEDNFAAQLSTTYSSSVQFMASYGLLNFYLFTMAYVYSPSPTAHVVGLEDHAITIS